MISLVEWKTANCNCALQEIYLLSGLRVRENRLLDCCWCLRGGANRVCWWINFESALPHNRSNRQQRWRGRIIEFSLENFSLGTGCINACTRLTARNCICQSGNHRIHRRTVRIGKHFAKINGWDLLADVGATREKIAFEVQPNGFDLWHKAQLKHLMLFVRRGGGCNLNVIMMRH